MNGSSRSQTSSSSASARVCSRAELRDDVQRLVRSAAAGERPAAGALEHVARFADAGSGGGLRWSAGRAVLSVQARGAPFDVLAEHLAPATLDLR